MRLIIGRPHIDQIACCPDREPGLHEKLTQVRNLGFFGNFADQNLAGDIGSMRVSVLDCPGSAGHVDSHREA